MNEPTHILHWVPPYVDGEGTWELQDIASYEADEPQLDPEWSLPGEPRGIDGGDFAAWMAEMTGCPVAARESFVRITCPRALRFRCREPAWYVIPVAQNPAGPPRARSFRALWWLTLGLAALTTGLFLGLALPGHQPAPAPLPAVITFTPAPSPPAVTGQRARPPQRTERPDAR
jgi:hypothetical protein